MGKKGALNPADAYRKAQRKKELKKNKAERSKARDFSLVKKDTWDLEDEIDRLVMANNPDEQPRLAELKAELEKINRKKAEYVTEHPEHRRLVYRPRRTEGDPLPEEIVLPKRRIFNKHGLPRHPDRSIYYDPIMNPYGVPPPGMPYEERARLPGEVWTDEEGEDDDIAMPAGPPPGSGQDEDFDVDDIPMPNALPPGHDPTQVSGAFLPPLPPGSGSTPMTVTPPLPLPIGNPPYSAGIQFLPPPPPPISIASHSAGGQFPVEVPPHAAGSSFPPPPPPPFPIGFPAGGQFLLPLPPPPPPSSSLPIGIPIHAAGAQFLSPFPPSLPLGTTGTGLPPPPPPPMGFPSYGISYTSVIPNTLPHSTASSTPIESHKILPQLPQSKIGSTTLAHPSLPPKPPPYNSIAKQSAATDLGAATVIAAPELRNLKKEATEFVPTAIRRKKPNTPASSSRVNAAPSMEDDANRGSAGPSRPDLLSTLKDQFGPAPSATASTTSKPKKVEKKQDDYDKFMEDMKDILEPTQS